VPSLNRKMDRIRTKTSSLAAAKYHLTRAILEQLLDDNYTRSDRDDALRYFGGCAFCGGTKAKATRNDHLVAVRERGDFVPKNVVPACQRCDDSKGKRDYREWMRSPAFRSIVHGRNWTTAMMEERIKLIRAWQRGYRPRSEIMLFGRHLARFKAVQREAECLQDKAKRLVRDVQRDRKR
jgi:hypothetical protein